MFYVVYIHTGDYLDRSWHNRSGADAYCEELNRYAGGPAYKVVSVAYIDYGLCDGVED